MSCTNCGFNHQTPRTADEYARCENARAIGKKLATRLNMSAVPRACDQSFHERVKASEAAFLLGTSGWKEWDDSYDVLCIGQCRKCGSTLAIKVRNSDSRLAAAVEALKGDGR